jgi:hypothetical protein
MTRLTIGIDRYNLLLLVVALLSSCLAFAQSETATLSGRVSDPSGLSVRGAQVNLIDIDRGVAAETRTDRSGSYRFASIHPGRYRIEVRAEGFRVINLTDLIVNVQDHLQQNFRLNLGSVSESVTVNGGAPLVDTESGSVSTVVDRQFAENVPMNGRSFQSLIELSPGVVVTATNAQDNGQFSINGQRPSSNYWMVDGVSANIGISSGAISGNGFGGAAASFSALGGTNSLVSIDALEEFRLQTSTYAPEFGRTPGGQISIMTRSGTNQFHGTLFDYFRNGALDANNWFADTAGLSKPQEKQNDFGGTLGGAIVRDKTFFFFSYEGLRLRLPQTVLTTVPCDSTCGVSGNVRASAVPAMQPFLNAYPLPNGEDRGDGTANFNATFINPGTLNAYSLRIDHRVNHRLTTFARYNYSPSELDSQGADFSPLSVVELAKITTQTATIGATWLLSPNVAFDSRFNYSRTNSDSLFQGDGFGGAIPLSSLPWPPGVNTSSANFTLDIFSLMNGYALNEGKQARNVQRQLNLVQNLSVENGTHALKFGLDFRRLSPSIDPPSYSQQIFFSGIPAATQGNADFGGEVASYASATQLFHNIGAFAQDTWHLGPRLTLTYGVRWELDSAPSALQGPSIPSVVGYNLADLSGLRIAPSGVPPFKTTYGNVAPRVGFAQQIFKNHDSQTTLRGGFGIFYDLVSAETGNLIGQNFPPFGAFAFPSGNFPFNPTPASPSIPGAGSISTLATYNPSLRLPYTLEWNIAAEQSFGDRQSISVTYSGAIGKRLLQTNEVLSPPSNPEVLLAIFTDNTASSKYDSLQVKYQRRLSHGLQALGSFTWSKSTDDGSAGSIANLSNTGLSNGTGSNEGPSDFDIRASFSAGVTYNFPSLTGGLGESLVKGWSLDSFFVARSSPPVNVYEGLIFGGLKAFETAVRPDVTPGIPLYLYGSQYPGGKAINFTPGVVSGGCPDGSVSIGPFCPPPQDPTTGAFLRQGNLGRNTLRGFGATQWDFALHRDFRLGESFKLQVRAEMFNILNHPDFGPPNSAIGLNGFGRSTQTLNQSLSTGTGSGAGGLNPLYQLGGPRSIQLALKLIF